MGRHSMWMAAAAALAIPATVAAQNVPAAAHKQQQRPNIVLIYADDMAWGDLSANGARSWVATPNLDKLAADGIRFTNGYSAAPLCGPSRVGLLTGAYPARFGTWWNPDTTKTKLPASQVLLPDLVRKAGYVSGVIGKWNLPVDPRNHADTVSLPMIWGGAYWPNAEGKYPGVGIGTGSGGGGEPSGLWAGPRPGDKYLTDMLTQSALDFIGANAAKPFFLYLAYNAPHSPLQAAERYRKQVAHLPSEPQRLYAAMVLALDEGVGRVRAELKARGLDKKTIVIFASDNGPARGGFRGYKPEWPAKMQLGVTGALSGGKATFREGGIREPFLISWPATIAPGQVRHDPISTLDLYRTVASWTGAGEPAANLRDGDDLSAYLAQPKATLPERDMFWVGRVCRQRGCVDSGAYRRGKWKLLIEDGGAPKLFDLAADPGEARDRGQAEGARLKQMSATFQQWKAALPPNASGTAGKPGGGQAEAGANPGANRGGPCAAVPKEQRAACRADRQAKRAAAPAQDDE